jgi:hypothetical protein
MRSAKPIHSDAPMLTRAAIVVAVERADVLQRERLFREFYACGEV